MTRDYTVYEQQRNTIRELQEAIDMAANRLEAALAEDKSVCRGCVETAKSYLDQYAKIER